jgi:hypothetical protein
VLPEDVGIYRLIVKDVACFIQCENLWSNVHAPAMRIVSTDESLLYSTASKSLKTARCSERGDALALLDIDLRLLLLVELLRALLICAQPLQSQSHMLLNFDITHTFHLPERHLNYVLNVSPMHHLR